jgi:hypothetical protein
MSSAGRRAVWVAVAVVVVVVGAVIAVFVSRHPVAQAPACTVTPVTTGGAGFALSPEQTDNAATIAAVGQQLGMPAHAVTVAFATALQESHLINLAGGDLDSAGLFQQRPSEGWGTHAQVTDPVHASLAFYQHLRTVPGWTTLSVTDAAQRVQHSGAPDAYAQWEDEARALAVAFTGQRPAALTCQHLTIGAPQASLAGTAAAEWGTSTLPGPHPADQGWAMSTWLVAHAQRLGVDKVTFAGRTWTAGSGQWSADGPAVDTLSLHQVPVTSGSP